MFDHQQLTKLDHDHVWHPFTPMRQWRESPPLIIERADGFHLFDTEGNRYIDGVSSLWCNVHGHRVPAIDQAVRDQLDKVAHTTLLGMGSPPSIELAAELAKRSPGQLSKVFYSDAGATALEVAFKMAVGYWHHTGKPQKHKFIGLAGAYHGDTAAAMSVGYSPLFHTPFLSMLFPTTFTPNPDPCRPAEDMKWPSGRVAEWPSKDAALSEALRDYCLAELEKLLQAQGHETAALVVEPMMQGAAGMIPQPAGFLRGAAELARKYDVLFIADEVATGFGRTGAMFACEHEQVEPDIMCLAKGITGGYLPLAATLCTDRVEQAFCGQLDQRRTLYHGHTYTGNPLACAAALASLRLFDQNGVLAHARKSAAIITEKLAALCDHPHVLDVRQRGLMVGIELCRQRKASGGGSAEPFDFSKRTAAAVCLSMRPKGLIIRPLGDVMVLMPAPAMDHATLTEMLDIVVTGLREFRFQ